MSSSELDRFETDLKSDDSMHDELVRKGQDADAVVMIANAHGYEITHDDVRERVAAAAGELSEEQLDDVTGGFSVMIITTGGALVVSWKAR